MRGHEEVVTNPGRSSFKDYVLQTHHTVQLIKVMMHAVQLKSRTKLAVDNHE